MHILFATAGTADDQEAITAFLHMLGPSERRVTALAVVPLRKTPRGDDETRAYYNAASERAEHRVAVAADVLAHEGERPEWLIRYGDPATEILDAARELGVDVIVLAPHDRHGLARLVGGVTERVMREAPCGVLLFPPASLHRP